MKEILFVGLVLAFSLTIFGLIARAMIVDSREHVRYNYLVPARRLAMDPQQKRIQRSTVVQLSRRIPVQGDDIRENPRLLRIA